IVSRHDRAAYEDNGASGFSTAYDQRLSGIGASLARGGKSTFEFAAEKCVGDDVPCVNALALCVQKSRVGNVVRGRNKIFQQRPQFPRFHGVAFNISVTDN